ncbi:unnamed protein product [Ixodes persulcatus]
MLPSCIALLALMLSTFPAAGVAVSSTSASPTATKDMEAKESSKSLVTLTPPSITQSASYQYGYEVGTVDSTLFKGQAKEQGGLIRGTYAYKDDSGQYRQVGDKAPTPTAASYTMQTDPVLQKLKQSDKAQVFFEPKAPAKEEASSLITSYEIPRASAIPKKGQANDGEATSNTTPKPTFFDQPAKVERKVVVTSGGGGSLPLTQRQQKRVTVIHKSTHSEQSSDKSRSSPRTFTKTFRGPQYRPTLRPQVRYRTTSPPSNVDYDFKQTSYKSEGPRQTTQDNGEQQQGQPLTTEESYTQEQRSNGRTYSKQRPHHRENAGKTFEIRTPHATQYMSFGDASKESHSPVSHKSEDTTQTQPYPDQTSKPSGYKPYTSSPSYDTTASGQQNKDGGGGNYGGTSQQGSYYNQNYNGQNTGDQSVTVGATTKVSGYNQDYQAGYQGTNTRNDQYEYHRGTAYPARVSDNSQQTQGTSTKSNSYKTGYQANDRVNTGQYQDTNLGSSQQGSYQSQSYSTNSEPAQGLIEALPKASYYKSDYQSNNKQQSTPRPQTFKPSYQAYKQQNTHQSSNAQNQNVGSYTRSSTGTGNYRLEINHGSNKQAQNAPAQNSHYQQAQALPQSQTPTNGQTASKQQTAQYSKPAPPALRNLPVTHKPQVQEGVQQVAVPPPPPTPAPQDAQVLLVEINNQQGQAHIQAQQLNAQQQAQLFQQRPFNQLFQNQQTIPLEQALQFFNNGQNQGFRVPIIEMGAPLMGNLPQSPNFFDIRQQIQQQLQQQQHQAQQPFLFGRPDALQQMLKQQQQQQFFMPQNQGFQKIITQGPVPIELKVEPLYDMNKGVGHNIGIKDVRVQALKPINLPLQGQVENGGQSSGQSSNNGMPYEVSMLVDAAKKALMSTGAFPKQEVFVVDASQGGQLPYNVLQAVQQAAIRGSPRGGGDGGGHHSKDSAHIHQQQKVHLGQAFPGATSVKVNDKLNVQVAGLLVNNQGLFPKHLLQGIGTSKLRFNEPLNVHIPIGELPPRPAVNVRIKGPDGKISQVLVPLHDATKLAALNKLENNLQGGQFQNGPFQNGPFQGNPFQAGPFQAQHIQGLPFQAGAFQGSRGFHAIPAPDLSQKEGLLLGGSTQEPAFGLIPQGNFQRLGEKVSLMEGLQLADLPHFDPSALAGAEMVPLRSL